MSAVGIPWALTAATTRRIRAELRLRATAACLARVVRRRLKEAVSFAAVAVASPTTETVRAWAKAPGAAIAKTAIAAAEARRGRLRVLPASKSVTNVTRLRRFRQPA